MSELTFLEQVFLAEGMDPKLVHEIQQIVQRYSKKAQVAFMFKYLEVTQDTASMYLRYARVFSQTTALFERILLRDGMDPRKVHEIKQILQQYSKKDQITLMFKCLEIRQEMFAELLRDLQGFSQTTSQATVSRYYNAPETKQLEEEVKKLLTKSLKMNN